MAISVSTPVSAAYDQLSFYWRIVKSLPKALRYPKEIVALISDITIGTGALVIGGGMFFVVVSIAFFTGTEVGLEGFTGLQQIGAQAFTGVISSLANTREITPLIAGIALAAQVGAGYTAQLGAMRISEEIDALEVLGVDSVVYLVATRVWAALITMIPLYLAALFASFIATQLIVTDFFGLSVGTYQHYFHLFLPPIDIFYSFVKAMIFAVAVTFVHCYYGYRASGGPAGVGVAAGRAIRISIITVVLLNFLLSTLLFGGRRVDGEVGRMSNGSDTGRFTLAMRTVAVGLAAVLVVGGVMVLVKNSDGGYNGDYEVVGSFTASGQGLHNGSEVEFDGVQVGQVNSIALVNGRAQVTLSMEPTFKFPADSLATIEPQNLFGAEEVNVTSASGRSAPWLGAGGVIQKTAVSSQLDDLFAAADPLLSQIDTTDLSSSLSELNQATNGEGQHIASGIEEGTQLSTLLSNTLAAQLKALDSLTALSDVLAPTGADFNNVAAQANAALPAIDNSEADFQALLDSLTPLSNNIAQFLSVYQPDIDTLLVSGDNVTRVLLAHQSDIAQLIHGTYTYLAKLGSAAGDQTLPDGSKFAYFRTFVQFSDVNSLVCNLVAPAAAASPSLAALAPLQQALGASGSPFNCSAEVTTFNAIQQANTSTSTPAPAPSTPTPATTAQQGQQATNQLYQSLAAPQVPTPQSLSGLLNMVAGGL